MQALPNLLVALQCKPLEQLTQQSSEHSPEPAHTLTFDLPLDAPSAELQERQEGLERRPPHGTNHVTQERPQPRHQSVKIREIKRGDGGVAWGGVRWWW